jgi:acyl dehydratase
MSDHLGTGTVVDEVDLDVERGKIREFARATHTQDPVHTDVDAARAAGFDSVLATPTHVVVAGHYRDQADFVRTLGLDIERVVVGGVRWHYERPLQAGDTLHATRRLVGDDLKEGSRGGSMRLLTLETEYVDDSGQVVVRVVETILERGAPR